MPGQASDIEGRAFAGYRIESVVGRGGMGVVYRATQLDLGRTVALKVIAPDLLEDPSARRRFLQESRLAASIRHPHAIPIHAAGEEHGVPYLVMELVEGDDACDLVRREGPLAPERAARIVAQVAGALDAAHAAGLVHRDVKPGNVLLAAGDHAYLSDFGLTRHVRSLSGRTPGRLVGTLDYAAPEQIRGGHMDARADVYALGCLLFFLLAGDVPFPHETDEARLWAHLTEPPPRVTAVAPSVPARMDAVIGRALAKAPDDRFPSAGDLGRAAIAAAAGSPAPATERAVAVGAAAAAERPTHPSAGRSARRRWWLAGPTLLVLAAATLLLWPRSDAGGVGVEPTVAPTPTASPAAKRTSLTPRVVARVRVGRRPNALVSAGGHLWVGSYRSPTLDAIDVRRERRIRRLHPDVGAGVADLTLARGTLWVATRGARIVRLDPVSGLPAGAPIALAMNPVVLTSRGNDVIAGIESQDHGILSAQLLRLDARTGAVEATVQVAHGFGGALYARGRLWTLHGAPNFIVRRDPVTLRAQRRIDLPGTTVGSLAHGAGALWATIPDQDLLVRWRPRQGERAEVEVGARPGGIQVGDGRVWVASTGSSTLDQVGAHSLRPVGRPLRVPLNPHAIALAHDGLWMTSVGQNMVARVRVRA
jgi:protein kinase-like protein